MKTEVLKFSVGAIEAIQVLRIKVELNEKTHLRCKNTDELVQLLEIATRSNSAQVKEALQKFVTQLSSQQLGYFEKIGLVLEPAVEEKTTIKSYRGVPIQDVVKPDAKNIAMAEPPIAKRKIIYRGQVKWV